MPPNRNAGVRPQKLRNFTVQIRHATNAEQIVGTGVVVSTRGEIVTCALSCAARAEAAQARAVSRDMGYHWGQADAEEVLVQPGN